MDPKALTLMLEVPAECALLLEPPVTVRAGKGSLPGVGPEVADQ